MGGTTRVMTLGACAIRALWACRRPRWPTEGARCGSTAAAARPAGAAGGASSWPPRPATAWSRATTVSTRCATGRPRAPAGPPLDAAAADRLERALTAAMERYLLHLRHGRVDPHQVHHHFTPPPADVFDAAAALRAALAAGDLAQAERAAAPPLAQYGLLREALARQRALADHAGLAAAAAAAAARARRSASPSWSPGSPGRAGALAAAAGRAGRPAGRGRSPCRRPRSTRPNWSLP